MDWNYFIFCQFFLRTPKELFVPWHVGIHHSRLLYVKIEGNLHFMVFKISTI